MSGDSDSAGFGPDFVPRRRDGVAGADFDGELVLYDGETEQVAHLDRLASAVWQCIDGEGTLRELAEDFAAVSGADETTVARDLEDVMRHLAALGFLDGVDRPDNPAPHPHDHDQPDAPAAGNGAHGPGPNAAAGPARAYIAVPPSG